MQCSRALIRPASAKNNVRQKKDTGPTVLRTKVLIIGSGAAGMSAALHLKTDDAILLEMPGASSLSAPWNIMTKPARELREKMLEAGCGMNDQKILSKFIRSRTSITDDLTALGITLRESNIGVIPDYPRPGAVIREKLFKCVSITRKQGRVDRFIVNQTGKIAGVSATLSNAKRHNVFFDYLIIAGGGLSGLFKYASGDKFVNGSMLALCYKSGLTIRNIEFMMFHPFLITDSRFDNVMISGDILTKMTFVDSRGRPFLSEKVAYALAHNEHHYIFSEMVREFFKQSLKGKIFAEIRCTPEWFAQFKKQNEFGFVFRKYRRPESIGRIEIHPTFHFSIGGIEIDDHARTSQDTIYAAGEITGGLHGGGRVGGTALAEAWAFGKIAALDINKRVGSEKKRMQPGEQRLREIGTPTRVTKELKDRIWSALGPVKNKSELKRFVAYLNKNRTLLGDEGELVKKIAEISLLRKESVGAFYREDLPLVATAKNSCLINGTITFK